LKNHIASLKSHMEMFCEIIGARPTGSASNETAVDYAASILQKNGLEVCKQDFDCIDWINSGATLLVDNQNVPVVSAEYSLPCNINAEFICVDTLELLIQTELSGKIALLHGDLCSEPLMPKNFEFYNPDDHKQIIALLEEKNPAAIITVNPHKEHIIQDGDFNIPCAVVATDMKNRFLQAADRTACLSIDTKRIPTKSYNVIATYGAGFDKICFFAHIDTKPTTPGALDNASGVAVLLAFAETLSDKGYPFQIEIALLNGEDYYSTPGEVVFMKGIGAEYKLAINIDGVGLKNSATSISFYECPDEIQSVILRCVGETAGIEQIEPWPMGDHMIFAMNGIPTVAITASKIFDLLETVIHSSDDEIKSIDFNILSEIVNLLISYIKYRTR